MVRGRVTLLNAAALGLPVTGFANSPDDTGDLLNFVGGAPVVIKLLEGTQGVGVVLGETRNAAKSVIEAFRGLDAVDVLPVSSQVQAIERDFGTWHGNIDIQIVSYEPTAKIEARRRKAGITANADRGTAGLHMIEKRL